MKKLDEGEIIKIFQKKLGNKKFEDVEVLNFDKIKFIAKTDTLVESTDIPRKMKLSDAARKSVVACVSDFAAKGVKPKYVMISINIPKSISRPKINEIATGFKNACKEFGILFLGGDTNGGKEIVFNVCLFGISDRIISRKDSKIGDLIFVTGPFGYTSAGLDMMLNKKRGKESFAKKSINAVVKPKPRLDFALKNKKYFSSTMDSSDGLSTTLNEMSNQSKKKFVINNIPFLNDLKEFAKESKNNLNDLVFNGGEEYEFVFTTSPNNKNILKKNAKMLKTPIIEIGYVSKGKGVFLKTENKSSRLKDLGWKHLS